MALFLLFVVFPSVLLAVAFWLLAFPFLVVAGSALLFLFLMLAFFIFLPSLILLFLPILAYIIGLGILTFLVMRYFFNSQHLEK